MGRPSETVILWSAGAPGAQGTGVEDTPALTMYYPSGNGPFACVVVCPGGGYGGRAAHEGEPVALWLNTLGIAAGVLRYRVSPYRHPCPLGDAQRAIRTLRAHADEWEIDPARIGILGFSAGGHLACSAATLHDDGDAGAEDPLDRFSSRPDCLIACYPVVSFGEFRHHGSMVNLLGSDDPDPVLRSQLSLENSVTSKNPPAFVWHTSDDAGVPVENALLFCSALRKHDVPFSLHVFPQGAHGLGLASDNPTVSQWTTLCARWLVDLGFSQ